MKRIYSLDAMKAIAAFLVICIHIPFPGIIGEIITPIARVAVPYFFVVSGFFMWDNNPTIFQSKIRNSIPSIFWLILVSNTMYFLWGVLKICLVGKDLINYLSGIFTLKNLLIFIIFNESPFASHLWYLSAYIAVLIICYLLSSLRLLNSKIFILIPFLLITDLVLGKYSLLLFNQNFSYLFVRNFLFVGMPYFMIGVLFKRLSIRKNIETNNLFLILACVIFTLSTLLEKFLLTFYNINGIRDHYISSTFLVISLFAILLKEPRLFKNKFLTSIGKYHSLNIYLIHYMIIEIIKFIDKNGIFDWIAPFVVYFISLICSMIYIKFKLYFKELWKYVL